MNKKIKNLPNENPFDFTEYVKKQKDENEIDLNLFLELAKGNRIIYNQTPVNNRIEDMEKLRYSFFTKSCFIVGDDEGSILVDFLKTVMN